MARLKLATYNINGIRARLGALLQWLEREQPDIVCLQELKAPDEAFPAGDIEALGYGALWHGQKSWNGVAILARGAQPEERRRGLPGGEGDTQSRYLEASVHGLVVGCLYLPNGNPWPGPKFDYKLDWFERLIRHARGLLHEGGPVVLAGDFNVVPTDELDIYDPKSWRKDALLQPESREAWFRLLEQGWMDALRSLAGDAKVFTFWDYFRRHWERDAGLRIDHLLLSPALAPLLADAGVDRWVRGQPGASDHAPTWVLLEAGRGAGKVPRKAAGSRRTVDASDSGASSPVAKRTGPSKRSAAAGGAEAAAGRTTRRAATKKVAVSAARVEAAGPARRKHAATTNDATRGARKQATDAGPATRRSTSVKGASGKSPVKKAAAGKGSPESARRKAPVKKALKNAAKTPVSPRATGSAKRDGSKAAAKR